ncbi:hypothetical protein Ahy_A06g029239 [Arachis hypogaea]|uniref:Zinc finger GRF-type domain-containing protein n=1 Tax=Arachis hypogaea TaxID=3818 RepID=A0A445CSW4_ARAHY|nr:hypothetical protein Ahy_A06g029239 [Arachis hypogaea]
MASGGNSASSYHQRVIRGSGDGSASSASGGPKFGIARGENPRCHCGAYAIVVESGTDKNPRRPFFGCPYYRVRNIGRIFHTVNFLYGLTKFFPMKWHEMGDSQHNVVLEERVKKLKIW